MRRTRLTPAQRYHSKQKRRTKLWSDAQQKYPVIPQAMMRGEWTMQRFVLTSPWRNLVNWLRRTFRKGHHDMMQFRNINSVVRTLTDAEKLRPDARVLLVEVERQ